MKTFDYISREYVPSIDLDTLGKTYDTLEQGHKEAVKAASDLEVAISNLDMNEAEDGFKQQLVNEIKQTVEDNTIYGNSYGALDDLIMKSGNIATDGRVIGRLRNQAAKKEYDAKVDAMNITNGMKEMYKEENPYYYEDGKIDKKTGRYMAGEKWQAKTNPVNTVSEAEIQKYVLQIVAKDAGGGNTVTFLDEYGRPTLDPSKSVDGAIYKNTGTKYERLSEDKIKQAYNVALDTIPGARDSIKQDYKYEQWKYDKLIKNNKNIINPYVPGYTDKNGNIYTEEQWLNNKINNFADVAAYNHVYSDVSYGNALANKKAREQQARNILPSNFGGNNDGFGTVIVGFQETEGNIYAGAEEAKSTANKQGLSIVKKLIGNKIKGMDSITDAIKFAREQGGAHGPNTAAQYLIKKYGQNLSQKDKVMLINSFSAYVRANTQMQQMINNAGEHADGLRFESNFINQEYTNDNKYGREIINELNKWYKDHEYAEWTVGKEVFDIITSKYGTDEVGMRNLGFNIFKNDDDTYNVKIDAKNRMLLPKFASLLREADDEVPNKSAWNPMTVINHIGNRLFGTTASNQYSEPQKFINYIEGIYDFDNSVFSDIVDAYNDGIEAKNEAHKKVGNAKGTVTYNAFDDSSFGALWARENSIAYDNDPNKIKKAREEADAYVDSMLANGLIDAGQIEYIDKSGNTTKNVSQNQNAKLMLQKLYRSDAAKKYVKRNCIVPKGTTAGQAPGYVIGFTVPKGLETGDFKEGETYTITISGMLEEYTNYNPSANPDILAENMVKTARSINGSIDNLGYNEELGDTRFIPTNNSKYSTNIFGCKKNIDEQTAKKLIGSLYSLENIKGQYQSGVFNDINKLTLLKNSIEDMSNYISSMIDVNPNDIEMMIGNYLLKEE